MGMVKRQRTDPKPLGADELADEIGDKRENGYKYQPKLASSASASASASGVAARDAARPVPTSPRGLRGTETGARNYCKLAMSKFTPRHHGKREFREKLHRQRKGFVAIRKHGSRGAKNCNPIPALDANNPDQQLGGRRLSGSLARASTAHCLMRSVRHLPIMRLASLRPTGTPMGLWATQGPPIAGTGKQPQRRTH